MKFYNKNKGAALVSILIAATFLTIIASTVLLISASNYSMKAISLYSRDNYYETEAVMNSITAKIRSGLTGITASASSDCKALIGVDENGRYDCMAIAKLIYPDSEDKTDYRVVGDRNKAIVYITEGNKETKVYIQAATKLGTPNFLYENSSSGMMDKLTLKDVSVSRVTSDEYENTITTDIEIYVERTMPKANIAGLGSFSLIMDAPLELDSNTRVNAYGNTYIADYHFNGTSTDPGEGAIVLNNSAILTMVGPYNVVYGDVCLNGKSVLNVTEGDLSVFGNIYVNDEAALIMSEDSSLYIAEGFGVHTMPTSKNNVLPITLTDEVDSSIQVISLSDKAVFDSLLGLNDGTKLNDGFICAICDENKPLDGLNGEKAYFYDCGLNVASRTESVYYNEPIKAMIYNDRQINETAEYALVMNNYADQIAVSNPGSTILSKTSLRVVNTKNLSLTYFGAERYAYITAKDRLNASYDQAACEMRCNIPYSKANPSWSQGNLTYQVGGFFKEDVDDVINGVLGIASNSSGLNTKPKTVAGYANWKKDDDE